jgi:outer membrane protein OmpA-like peptidoglycan-associated protein
MHAQSDDEQLGLVLGLVFAVIALVIVLVIGIAVAGRGATGPGQTAQAAVPSLPAVAAAVPVPAPAAAPLAAASDPAQAAADAASITVEYGVVKFYFAPGKAELAGGAGQALAAIVQGAKSGRKVVISGFHDASGNAASNAELARRRALAVRGVLKAAGVAQSQIRLEKPVQTAETGSAAEARRVEIALQ